MAARLFLFVQMEFPWELGPADGRYLLRKPTSGGVGGDPDRVVVLDTVGAARRRGRLGARRPPATPEPAPVPTSRATVIDPVSVSAEGQARKWLAQLDVHQEASAAAATVNRVLLAHRIATADPHVRELSPAHALVVRAGWGEGEQVAYGHWLHARELRLDERRTRRRSAALRSHEHFAALLGAREQALVCEELALRARLDLDEGRLPHAALELEHAYTAALAELTEDERPDLAERIAELVQLRPGVIEAARIVLGGGDSDTPATAGRRGSSDTPAGPDEEVIRHALGRLEAALRARAAAELQR
ncbi:MAG TPA: hypothetical protein VNY52_05615 [Solirubrobacteraceae bacterium]|jgi:hypothetical protein|nr:hypothetical protein [Solirubrobacteraceae bacterium]